MPRDSVAKTIALVGGGMTRQHAHDLDDDVLMWTLNRMGMADADGTNEFPRIDRLIEIHPEWFVMGDWYDYGPEYREWLVQEHPYPIYMQEVLPHVPQSVNYPLEAVLNYLFEHLWIGPERADYMTSSFSYLFALATYELRNVRSGARIEVYGFEMSNEAEYAYQKPGGLLIMGVAAGKGIDVWTPEDSNLLRANLYGYEVFDMIPRQMLEEWKLQFQKDLEKHKALLNQREAEGRLLNAELHDLRANGAEPKEVEELQSKTEAKMQEWQDSFGAMRAADGAVQVCEKLIAKCDLQDVPMELFQTIGRIDVEARLKETALE